MNLRKVASKQSLVSQKGRVLIVDHHPIALFNLNGEYVAFDNTCPHQGGSLGTGKAKGDTVICPWHGWEFNCRTGEAIHDPEIKVKRYTVVLENDDIYLVWPEE